MRGESGWGTERERSETELQKIRTCLASGLIPNSVPITLRFARRSPRFMNVRSPDDGLRIDVISINILVS